MCDDLRNSASVQTHVSALQGIISRMASNSSNCKIGVTTVVSAIIVLLMDKSQTDIILITLIPIIMFFVLDCYYLGLERFFRNSYEAFVAELESGNFNPSSIFLIKGPKGIWKNVKNTLSGIWSFSTTPFYAILAILVIVIRRLA